MPSAHLRRRVSEFRSMMEICQIRAQFETFKPFKPSPLFLPRDAGEDEGGGLNDWNDWNDLNGCHG